MLGFGPMASAPNGRSWRLGVVSLMALAPLLGFAAEESWPDGREVAQRINARNSGAAVSRTLLMELTEPRGQLLHRKLRSLWKLHAGGRHVVFFVLAPLDMKGRAYLANDYFAEGKEDDYWFYDPVAARTRRIAMSQRRNRFLGSDVTVQDIMQENRADLHGFTWKTIGREEVDGHDCYVVEQKPVSEKVAKQTGYGKIVAFVDRELWLTRKREYSTPELKQLKTFENKDIRQVSGIWAAHRIEITNHLTGHRTVLQLKELDYESEVDDGIFTIRALEKGPPR